MLPQPLKILLVDDDESDYFITRTLLDEIASFQFELDWESQYETALAAVTSNTHHVYLFDYRLGGHTGLELLHHAIEQGVTAPIVMLTGLGSETIAVETMRSGAADYIPKGTLSRDALERIITNCVEKHILRVAVEEKRLALEKSNRELLRRNEEIKNFYHTVSHELKTPLTAVREFVAIILEGLTGPLNDQQQEYLLIAKEGCDQMNFRLNDLLDATRLDTGKLRINPRLTSIVPLLTQSVASMALNAKNSGIHLQHEIPPGLSEALIDEQRINQVVTNLISNALKFTDRGGHVIVKASDDAQSHEYIRVSVSDTGRGIEQENVERIFDRLYQVRDEHNMLAEGLGLGLHISREIVRLHGGELTVESKPGVGSIFSINLPTHRLELMSDNKRNEEVT